MISTTNGGTAMTTKIEPQICIDCEHGKHKKCSLFCDCKCKKDNPHGVNQRAMQAKARGTAVRGPGMLKCEHLKEKNNVCAQCGRRRR